MPPENWERIKALLADALELAPGEREAFIARVEAEDPAAASTLRSLLRGHEEAGDGFLRTLGPGVVDGPTLTLDPAAAAPGAPMRIGPYRIWSTLGEGGFGIVYLAEQAEPVRRRVALKVIKPGMDTREVVARFEAERQALALMDHPSVARVFDAGTTPGGRPYFAMEYVPGVPITEYCDTHRLTMRERLELFIPVCQAVQHAHMKGIIHRDLKPTNVLVAVQDGRPVPKVIDFGIAKALHQRLTERTVFTEHGRMIGTPEYMSPEQAATTGLDIDTRTDVYSLGVILYELLVGALPFASRTLRRAGFEGIVRIIREQDPPKPSTRLSGLGQAEEAADPERGDGPEPPTAERIAALRRADPRTLARQLRGDLDWIAMKALEKDRTRRYQSPADLADDLRRFLMSEPVTARPPSVAYRASRFVRRHRMGVAAAAVVALALGTAVAGTAIGLVQARRAQTALRAERDAAERAREAAELARATEAVLRQEARAAHARAEREAAKQAAISAFLVNDLLYAAAPERSLGHKITVEEALDRASERVGEAFVDQPEVESAVRTQIGATYFRLGLLDRAEPHWTAAVELARRAYGEEHQDAASAMLKLALLYQSQGRLEEARPLYARAVDVVRRDDPESEDTITTMSNYALFLYQAGVLDESLRVAQEAMATSERVYGADHAATLRLNGIIGSVHLAQGRIAEARAMFERTLEVRRRTLGPDHPDRLASLGNLAALVQRTAGGAEAEPLYRELIEAAPRVLGEEHPHTLVWMSNFATLLHARGESAEAEQVARRAAEARRRVSGEDHPETAASLTTLAHLLADQGKHDEAEALYRRVVDLRRRILPPGHHETGQSLASLGRFLLKQGRAAEAEPPLREALEIRAAALGEAHALTALSRSDLGAALGVLGRDDEAEPLLVAGARALLEDPKVLAPRKREAAERLVAFYEARKRPEAAEWRARLAELPEG